MTCILYSVSICLYMRVYCSNNLCHLIRCTKYSICGIILTVIYVYPFIAHPAMSTMLNLPEWCPLEPLYLETLIMIFGFDLKLFHFVYFLVVWLWICLRPAHVGHAEPSQMTAWRLFTLQTHPTRGLSWRCSRASVGWACMTLPQHFGSEWVPCRPSPGASSLDALGPLLFFWFPNKISQLTFIFIIFFI